MATIFDLEMTEETVKAVPPHKFWRGVWYSPIGFMPSRSFPSIRLDKHTIITGPVYPTEEIAEQKNLEQEARVIKKSNGTYKGRFVRAVKVDENGEPI